jgi:Ca-activated chloride channel family protein
MTTSSAPHANGSPPGNEGDRGPRIDARWEKPLIPATGGEATLLVRIIAPEPVDPRRAAPLDVAFVLDRSGSMRLGKLELAKEGVDLAVARLRDADRTALVVYDDAVDVIQPLRGATPRLKASLRLALHGVDPGGSTYLSGGWTAGCQQLATAPALDDGAGPTTRIRRVILLTDRLANVGVRDPRELAHHAGELRRRGIATSTLGVGADFDEGLLSAMAEAGGGSFQYAADPDALRVFFARELQELFSVGATGLTIALTLPSGVRAELVSAFPVEADDRKIEVAIGDLPAGDEIDLIFTVRGEPRATGEALSFGVIAGWTDPHADERRAIDASPSPLRAAGEREVAAMSADELVVERAALQRAAAERREGLELDRAGRYVESRARMARAVAFLQMAPESDRVQFDLAESQANAAAPATASYSSHERKTAQYREDQRRRGRFGRAPRDHGHGQ